MYRYREIAPAPAFAETVECYWTLEVFEDHQHLVVPDGCLDLILFWRGRTLETASVVGTMTKPRHVSLSAGQFLSGIRFHPGMFSANLQASIPALTNQEVALDALASSFTSPLFHALQNVTSFNDCFVRLEEALHLQKSISSTQRVIHEMCIQGGESTLSEGAAKAFLSDRQFRRVCFQETGITPKHLQRIARFRKAWVMIREKPSYSISELAFDCGYSDQAHLIREFREFAGTTPGNYVKSLL